MHGSDAGPSKRGQDADAINLHLCHADEFQKRILRISGTVQKNATDHQLAVADIEIAPDGYVFIQALGGQGGNGGRGGNVGRGGNGQPAPTAGTNIQASHE